ncbi:hypothetical protein RJ640_029122 [Escallonia rubra]|uniref:Rho GDP-dissociation inhibitor 1 n=1 Tax=Escallonia rubra TaxID=112253 RepID=A0AA88UJP9_9ASTE|nr:hypothetical protein RJ640_029122 [Escallonia rubra]
MEAGPSTGCSSDVCEEKKQMERTHKPEAALDVEGAANGDDDEHQENGVLGNFVPGPLVPLKDQLEKDKDDESLRRWKEKLLGCVESDLIGQMNPEVTFQSIGVISDDIGEISTPLPVDEGHLLFTLTEGSLYRFKLTFSVLHNIVSGLNYVNTVWKRGLQVDRSKGMLGTFAPQREPYVHTLDEETTPSGVLARGIYTAKLKFEDDDKRCYMELHYTFEIKKSR